MPFHDEILTAILSYLVLGCITSTSNLQSSTAIANKLPDQLVST